jgi:GT2 family glycosyltransferase
MTNASSAGKTRDIRLSLIIPVYNRPNEVKELLESLAAQTRKDFEVVLWKMFHLASREVVEQFSDTLNIRYIQHEKVGPGCVGT